MKFWFFIRCLFNCSNFKWFLFSNTLCFGFKCSFLQGQSYYAGCSAWLNISLYSCEWCQIFFYMYLSTHSSRNLLWFLLKQISLFLLQQVLLKIDFSVFVFFKNLILFFFYFKQGLFGTFNSPLFFWFLWLVGFYFFIFERC